jgi:glycosyltransferase involved in cell wall biosynthesis
MLPWKLQQAIEKITNAYHYFIKCNKRTIPNNLTPKITFICGFHGKSGGSQAIASIANLLSIHYNVTFISYPTSNINGLLSKRVHISNKIAESDLIVCDLSINLDTLIQLKHKNKKIIVSIHGFKKKSHHLSQTHIETVLHNVDHVHFVSNVQQSSYNLAPNKFFIIPNFTKPVNKTIRTNNIGTVGNLDILEKGAAATVLLGLASQASEIHLWRKEQNIWNNNRVICHSWESNKSKIYNSFDVLVFMSESETFGLVIIEAMSGGIPCVLLNLPVFEQFSNCPGIYLINDSNDVEAVKIINDLLKHKNNITEQLKTHYQTYYSETAILKQWENILTTNYFGKETTT